MKQILLFTLFIPALLWANDDSKYLAGAVPVENGKVVFKKEINAPSFSKDEVYNKMLSWANEFFTEKDSRVVYTEQATGEIAVIGETDLIFQKNALSLDRCEMDYRVTIKCEDKKSTVSITGIRYTYDVSYQKEPEKYTAEEWITDKYSLNKAKTKLNRGNGKFRRKTVDFVDDLANSASMTFGVQTISQASVQSVNQTQPQTVEQPTTNVEMTQTQKPVTIPATTPVVSTPVRERYIAFAADKVPSTIIDMLPNSDLQIVKTDQPETKETSVTWKGIGNILGKTITSTTIQANSPVYQKIGNNGTYSLLFFKKGETQNAWLIIDCIKQGETTEGEQKTLMGEILKVWMK